MNTSLICYFLPPSPSLPLFVLDGAVCQDDTSDPPSGTVPTDSPIDNPSNTDAPGDTATNAPADATTVDTPGAPGDATTVDLTGAPGDATTVDPALNPAVDSTDKPGDSTSASGRLTVHPCWSVVDYLSDSK